MATPLFEVPCLGRKKDIWSMKVIAIFTCTEEDVLLVIATCSEESITICFDALARR